MKNFVISGPFPARKAFQVLRDRLIAHLIDSGAEVGDDFCSEARLMEISGLSRTTVRKAVNALCAQGWVERRAGVGSFVGPRVALPRPPENGAGKPTARRDVIRVAVLLHLQGEGGVDYFTRGVLQGLDSAALEEGLSVSLVGDSNMDVPHWSNAFTIAMPTCSSSCPPRRDTPCRRARRRVWGCPVSWRARTCSSPACRPCTRTASRPWRWRCGIWWSGAIGGLACG
jgi:DNA-binding transcriptional regulator YhcF (GntR family)